MCSSAGHCWSVLGSARQCLAVQKKSSAAHVTEVLQHFSLVDFVTSKTGRTAEIFFKRNKGVCFLILEILKIQSVVYSTGRKKKYFANSLEWKIL